MASAVSVMLGSWESTEGTHSLSRSKDTGRLHLDVVRDPHHVCGFMLSGAWSPLPSVLAVWPGQWWPLFPSAGPTCPAPGRAGSVCGPRHMGTASPSCL